MNAPSTPSTSANPPVKIPCDVVYGGREVCGELALVEAREFIVTNGKGGYASLTAASSLTRSYHGLLIAALRPPLDRTLLLAKLNETATYLNRVFYLSTDRRRGHHPLRDSRSSLSPPMTPYAARPSTRKPPDSDLSPNGDVVSPLGYLHLQSFRLEGTVPVFTYAIADAVLEKRIWMKQGQNTVYVNYYLRRATEAVELELHAYVNHRNHHHRTIADYPEFDYAAEVIEDDATVRVNFLNGKQQNTTLFMKVDHGRAELANEWVRELILIKERARGLSDVDTNLHAATFKVDLLPGGRVTFVATAETDADICDNGEQELQLQHEHELRLLEQFAEARTLAQQRRRAITQRLSRSVPILDSWRISRSAAAKRNVRQRVADLSSTIDQLVLAADQFIISRAGGKSVVAGFHWFTDWARDVSLEASYLCEMFCVTRLQLSKLT